MDRRQELLVEEILFKEVRAFLECIDDKEEKKRMVRKHILEFNEEYGTKSEEVVAKLKTMLKEHLSNELSQMKLKEDNEEPEF